MKSNIEIKARDPEPARTQALAEQLSDTPPVVLEQHDTFFNCSKGRLKLREFSAEQGELIHYRRPDLSGPKQSDYDIVPVTEPANLRRVLTAVLGVTQVVIKTRTLLQAGQTRIHLDQVLGLGAFIELEVVLGPGQSSGDGSLIARNLMAKLQVFESDLVDCAYADLLAVQGYSHGGCVLRR